MSNDSSKPISANSRRYGPLAAIITTFAAYFIGSQIVLAAMFAIYAAVTGSPNDQAFDYFQAATVGQFLTSVGAYGGMSATVYLFMRWRKVSWSSIGLGRGPRFNDFGLSILTFVGYFILLAVILQLVERFIPGINIDQEQQIGFKEANDTMSLALVFISLAILPPIVEEIIVRGFLYTGLRNRWNRNISIVVASLLFGIAHLQLGSGAPPLYVAAIDTFVLSVVLIALREKTGSLWAGIMVHGLKNSLAFVVLFIFHAG